MKPTATFVLATMLSCSLLALRTARASQADSVAYVCPMHSDVTSKSSGKCPKCGMSLFEGPDPSPKPSGVKPEIPDGRLNVPDIAVLDQDGNPRRFYTDLVKGRTVAINFIFTTCTTICPPLTATFRRVQQDLGARPGRDVSLISVTVDPVTDVPLRLKSFSAKFNPQPGWTFVTGNKAEMASLLRSLGAYSGNKNDHTPTVLIINDRAKYWTRSYGLSPAKSILKALTEAADKTFEP